MDYALLAFASILGFGDGPWYLVAVIAGLLTLLSTARYRAIARQHSQHGAVRVFTVFAATSIANNVVFAAMSFGFGRGVAWLIST